MILAADWVRGMYLARGGTKNEIARRFHALFCHPVWNIGIVQHPIHAFLEPDARPEVRWFPPLQRGRYLADPFGIARGDGIEVLCEEFDYERNKGTISAIDVSSDLTRFSMESVIELPIHLSYPFLFEHEGRRYCVPETFEVREISLYQADEFPRRWRKIAVLVRGVRAHDTTLFQHGGRWWLGYTDVEVGAFDKLFLWHSEDLMGPWRPHRRNPVKIDARSARGAGTPFLHKGELYRPAQDCSRIYGERVTINRVVRLTPDDFEEEPAAIVEPFRRGPYGDGIHTLSAVGDVTLVDGFHVACVGSEFRRAFEMERGAFLRSIGHLLHRS